MLISFNYFNFFILYSMKTWYEYIISYHHGGTLPRDGDNDYINVVVSDFVVDPDKLWHWDLIGNVKELGYDIKKNVGLFYKDCEGKIKSICDDATIVG